MTGTEIALIITAIGGFITVVAASVVNTIVGLRTKELVVSTKSIVEEVAHATNSMKDELVAEVRTASVAKGLKQGREEATLKEG